MPGCGMGVWVLAHIPPRVHRPVIDVIYALGLKTPRCPRGERADAPGAISWFLQYQSVSMTTVKHVSGLASPSGAAVLVARVISLGLRGGGVVLTLCVLKACQGALRLGARGQDGLHRRGALLVNCGLGYRV
jgi:hypothetical protein